MLTRLRLVCCLLAAGALTAAAQTTLTPRTAELPPEGTYLPVDLDRLANDAQPVQFAADKVQVLSIPFNLPRKGNANCLFLKPIGWSGATNEDAEYPGYIARYDNWTEQTNDPARAMVRIPVGDYEAIWILAAADKDTTLSDAVTFRIGVAEGQGPVGWHDVSARVPRSDSAAPVGVTATIPTAAGNLYLIRVPFGQAIAQDYRYLRTWWLDITKELRVAINLPDPNRFQFRPLGPASGVRIYGITLQRAPLQMEMTASQPGNVFNEPQVPTFRLDLYNVLGEHWVPYSIETVATGDDGTVVRQVHTNVFRDSAWVYGNPVVHQTVVVPVPKRGLYRLQLSLQALGRVVTTRETTFALLAPDTRKYRDDAPFGTWDFGGGHGSPNDFDLRGPLYVKAGLRYGLSDAPESVRRQYGLLPGGDLRVRGTNEIQATLNELKEDPTRQPPARFLVFHEAGISGPHLTRTPDLFTGRPPYHFNADEEKTWKAVWDEAVNATRAIRANFPKGEIYFGNTTPHLLEEFLRHGWPCADLGTIGNESGCFMRRPETQPLDFVGGNSALWMLRQIGDHYGCTNIPLRQCLEICYPGSGPGNLTELSQAAYLVRHLMHFLAWRIPVIRPMTLTDAGNSYAFSNWGMAGLCYCWPNVSPKPAYVAYATLTQALDGARFDRFIPTDSTAVYAAEFRKRDKHYVTCLWTVHGQQPLTLKVPGLRKARVTDLMGREREVTFAKEHTVIEVSDRPCYVATERPIAAITRGAPVHETKAAGQSVVVSKLDKLADWTIETNRSVELETYNFLNPRRKGEFVYREVAAAEAGQTALEVKPNLPVPGSLHLQMYSVLALNKPVELPGQPTQVAVLVNGNGGWGRLIFELEDASGQRWISIGAEQAGAPNPWMADWLKPEDFAKLNPKSMNVNDWNSDDAWGLSFINFDGWRLLKFPLPGQYPGEGYHWPMNSQWRFSGDGVVHYPLKFKKLIVTMPERVLYGTQYVAPRRYEIQLRDLQVLYEPAEKVFAKAE